MCLHILVSLKSASQNHNSRSDFIDPAVNQNCNINQHLPKYNEHSVGEGALRVDGASIRVAREACGVLESSDWTSVKFDAKSRAWVKELAIADNTVKILPRPMSSAIIPLLASSR